MILCKLTAGRNNHCAIASWRIKYAGCIVCCGRIAWFESTKMILSLDSILNVRLVTNWRQSGNSLWGKGKADKGAAFFTFFFLREKILGPTGFDLRPNPPDDWKSNTLTTTPHFPAVINGSGDASTRENLIVLFLPLDGSATGPFRWTIPLRLIVQGHRGSRKTLYFLWISSLHSNNSTKLLASSFKIEPVIFAQLKMPRLVVYFNFPIQW